MFLRQALLVEYRQHPPDRLVHGVHHRGVGAPHALHAHEAHVARPVLGTPRRLSVVGETLVLRLEILGGFERGMRRQKRHVEEEGTLPIALADPALGLVRQQEGLVALVVDALSVSLEVLRTLAPSRASRSIEGVSMGPP